MRYLILFAFVFLPVQSAFAQYSEAPPLPPDQLAFRTRLEADASIVKLICGLMMPIDPKEMYAREATLQQAENNKLRFAFYKAAKRGKTVKAGYTCGADEGGTISEYLLVENGKITRVADFSRDPFGGRRIITWQCTDLALGNFAQTATEGIVFEVLKNTDLKNKVLWLTCKTDTGRLTF